MVTGQKIRIFAINEFEVWAAQSQKEAVKASMQLSGLSEDYTLDPYHAKEISLKEAAKHKVLSDGGDQEFTLLELYNGATVFPSLLFSRE